MLRLAWRILYGWFVLIGMGAGMIALEKQTEVFRSIYEFLESLRPIPWRVTLDVTFLLMLWLAVFPAFLASACVILRTGSNKFDWGRVAAYAAGAALVPGLAAIASDFMIPQQTIWMRWVIKGILLFSLPLAWCAFWALRSQARD